MLVVQLQQLLHRDIHIADAVVRTLVRLVLRQHLGDRVLLQRAVLAAVGAVPFLDDAVSVRRFRFAQEIHPSLVGMELCQECTRFTVVVRTGFIGIIQLILFVQIAGGQVTVFIRLGAVQAFPLCHGHAVQLKLRMIQQDRVVFAADLLQLDLAVRLIVVEFRRHAVAIVLRAQLTELRHIASLLNFADRRARRELLRLGEPLPFRRIGGCFVRLHQQVITRRIQALELQLALAVGHAAADPFLNLAVLQQIHIKVRTRKGGSDLVLLLLFPTVDKILLQFDTALRIVRDRLRAGILLIVQRRGNRNARPLKAFINIAAGHARFLQGVLNEVLRAHKLLRHVAEGHAAVRRALLAVEMAARNVRVLLEAIRLQQRRRLRIHAVRFHDQHERSPCADGLLRLRIGLHHHDPTTVHVVHNRAGTTQNRAGGYRAVARRRIGAVYRRGSQQVIAAAHADFLQIILAGVRQRHRANCRSARRVDRHSQVGTVLVLDRLRRSRVLVHAKDERAARRVSNRTAGRIDDPLRDLQGRLLVVLQRHVHRLKGAFHRGGHSAVRLQQVAVRCGDFFKFIGRSQRYAGIADLSVFVRDSRPHHRVGLAAVRGNGHLHLSARQLRLAAGVRLGENHRAHVLRVLNSKGQDRLLEVRKAERADQLLAVDIHQLTAVARAHRVGRVVLLAQHILIRMTMRILGSQIAEAGLAVRSQLAGADALQLRLAANAVLLRIAQKLEGDAALVRHLVAAAILGHQLNGLLHPNAQRTLVQHIDRLRRLILQLHHCRRALQQRPALRRRVLRHTIVPRLARAVGTRKTADRRNARGRQRGNELAIRAEALVVAALRVEVILIRGALNGKAEILQLRLVNKGSDFRLVRRVGERAELADGQTALVALIHNGRARQVQVLLRLHRHFEIRGGHVLLRIPAGLTNDVGGFLLKAQNKRGHAIVLRYRLNGSAAVLRDRREGHARNGFVVDVNLLDLHDCLVSHGVDELRRRRRVGRHHALLHLDLTPAASVMNIRVRTVGALRLPHNVLAGRQLLGQRLIAVQAFRLFAGGDLHSIYRRRTGLRLTGRLIEVLSGVNFEGRAARKDVGISTLVGPLVLHAVFLQLQIFLYLDPARFRLFIIRSTCGGALPHGLILTNALIAQLCGIGLGEVRLHHGRTIGQFEVRQLVFRRYLIAGIVRRIHAVAQLHMVDIVGADDQRAFAAAHRLRHVAILVIGFQRDILHHRAIRNALRMVQRIGHGIVGKVHHAVDLIVGHGAGDAAGGTLLASLDPIGKVDLVAVHLHALGEAVVGSGRLGHVPFIGGLVRNAVILRDGDLILLRAEGQRARLVQVNVRDLHLGIGFDLL